MRGDNFGEEMAVALPDFATAKVAIIGLGYVGLPLAVEFGKQRDVVGFDINSARIAELRGGTDSTLEVSDADLRAATKLQFSADESDLKSCDVFIITVPTPINGHKQPDLTPLIKASELLGRVISPGAIVIYESTVYPGATEEDCIPVIERGAGLVFNSDFYAGYSPERINPGDKQHRLPNIMKVTSGSTLDVADFVDALYNTVIHAGTFKASSIRVAEAAKVIENTQRDLNIALINELAIIFNRLGIDTEEVLRAAGTKWNFLPFRPGLVGGHCIGVDPYYLTYKAQSAGYIPDIILAGRRINDGMGAYVADELIKAMLKRRIHVNDSRVLVLGLAFKENCPDLRNTRVVDIVSVLESYGVNVDIHDPWVDPKEARDEYGVEVVEEPATGQYDAIVIAVAHQQFKELGIDNIRRWGKSEQVVYDLKYLFDQSQTDLRL